MTLGRRSTQRQPLLLLALRRNGKNGKKGKKLHPLVRTGLTRFTLSASEDKVRTHSEPVPECRVGAGSRDVCVDLGRRCLHGARSPSPSGQCVGLLGTDKVEIDFVLP